MPTAQATTTVSASPDRVWSFITALRFIPQWLDGTRAVHSITTAHTAPGTRFELLREGIREPTRWIVADWQPPTRLRYTEYDRDWQLWIALDPTGLTTRLTLSLDRPAPGGLLARLLPDRAAQSLVERSARRLSDIFALNRDIRLLHGVGDE